MSKVLKKVRQWVNCKSERRVPQAESSAKASALKMECVCHVPGQPKGQCVRVSKEKKKQEWIDVEVVSYNSKANYIGPGRPL